jgi:hypothetical protein
MKARVIRVASGKSEWYEVQVRILGFIWIDANLYKSSFPSVFLTLEEAMLEIEKLKKPKYIKTSVHIADL